jgi:hypothetical protein
MPSLLWPQYVRIKSSSCPGLFSVVKLSSFLSSGHRSTNQSDKLYTSSNDGDREPTQLLGRAFAEEAMRKLSVDRCQPNLALLQGIAALWTYEHLSGRSQSASQLLEELFRLHSHLETQGFWHSQPGPIGKSVDANACNATEDKRERHALSYASWGLYYLDMKICLSFHSAAHILRPCRPVKFGSDAWQAVDDSSLNLWVPYPIKSQPRLSYFMEAHASEAELSLLGGAIVLELVQHTTSSVPDYQLARRLYDRINGLKRTLPSGTTSEQPSNPMLVSLSITADVLALRVLEPFVDISFLEFDRGRSARSLVALHCESILSMLWNYRTAFGMRHDGWHLQTCSTAAHMLMLYLSPDRTDGDISTKSCVLLHEMGKQMPLANQSLLSLRTIVERREINLTRPARAHLMAGCLKTNNSVVLNGANILSDVSSGQSGGGLVLQQGSLSFTATIAESVVASVLVPASDSDDEL